MRRKSSLILLLTIIILALSTQSTIAKTPTGSQVDVLVTFTNPDGWTIVAKDGQQIAKKFTLTIYASDPGVVNVKLLLNDKEIKSEQFKIQFKQERTYTIPQTGSLTIQVIYTNENTSLTITKGYTVVVHPKPTGPNIVVFGPKQFVEYIHNIKMQTAMIAALFALLGVAMARFLKYNLKLLDVFNGMQLPAMLVMILAAYAIDQNLAWAYFAVALLSDLIAYGAMKGPETTIFWEIPDDSTQARELELPVYTTPEGYLAVAFQSVKHALGRLRGIHVPLKLEGRYKVAWTLNSEHRLFIARNLSWTEEEVEEIEEGGEEPEKTKTRVFKVQLADAHDINYLRHLSYFHEMKENCMRVYEENIKYRTALPLLVKQEMANIRLDNVIDIVKPELPEEVRGDGEPRGD